MFVQPSNLVAGAATRLLLFSAAFQHAVVDAKRNVMEEQIAHLASAEALGSINNLCLLVRNYQDKFPKNHTARNLECGIILFPAEAKDCDQVVQSCIYQGKPTQPLGIRDALNKFAHFDEGRSNYQLVERRHYLFLAGSDPRPPRELKDTPHWVAVVDVKLLALKCIESVRQLEADDA